jgi:Tol biopolymer transport system component
MACLSDREMLEFVQGRLEARALPDAERHLDECDACRQSVAVLLAGGPSDAGESTSAAPGRVGRYELLEAIGAGGMGVVYVARDPQLGRRVALKLLRPEAAPGAPGDPRARMLREARAMARLAHPQVVAIHDVGMHEDQVFVVMEMVEGGTLRQWLARERRSWRVVLGVLLEAGRGLAAAHGAGLVHRDLKPDNVLVGDDGRVRVTDFGLARLASSRETLPEGAVMPFAPDMGAATRTASGAIAGSPTYMSPEAARGEAVDVRGDIFSFCVTAYEALYGELPFAGETLSAIVSAAQRGEARPPPAGSRVPKALRDVLLRGLKARREDRFATMEELLAALEKAARRGRAKLLGMAAGLLIAALLAAGLFWDSMRLRAPTTVEPARFHRMTYSGRDRSPAASLDGSMLVFTSERDGRARIWLKRLASGQELALTSGPDERARLSPDGSRVMFVRDEGARNALYVAPISGGAPRKIAEDASDGDFSPDGRKVVFIRLDRETGAATTIEVATADGSDARDIFRLRVGAGSLDSPRWSPDGKIIAVRQAAASTGISDTILLVRADGTGSRVITPPGPSGRISALAFPESGNALLYAQSESLASTRAQVSSRMLRLNAATLQAETLFWVPERVQAVTLAGAGHLVFDSYSMLENLLESPIDAARDSRPEPPDSGGRWLTRGRSNDRQPVYSPEGEWVAFSSDRSRSLDLWKVSTKTGALQQLTDDPADDWDPAFTRDGKRLLWSSNRSGAFEIWTADADGRGARQLTRDGVDAENPTATPDGQWIVYGSANPSQPGIWKIRADGSQATRLVAGTVVWPEVSPDGTYAAYRNAAYDWPDSRTRHISIRVVRIADGLILPFEITLKSGLSAGRTRWMPDGRGLAFVGSDEKGVNGIFVQDFAPHRDTTATRRRLSGFSSRTAAESFSIAPDARRIIIAESEVLSSLMIADLPVSR